jgi:hypothetical protein
MSESAAAVDVGTNTSERRERGREQEQNSADQKLAGASAREKGKPRGSIRKRKEIPSKSKPGWRTNPFNTATAAAQKKKKKY